MKMDDKPNEALPMYMTNKPKSTVVAPTIPAGSGPFPFGVMNWYEGLYPDQAQAIEIASEVED